MPGHYHCHQNHDHCYYRRYFVSSSTIINTTISLVFIMIMMTLIMIVMNIIIMTMTTPVLVIMIQWRRLLLILLLYLSIIPTTYTVNVTSTSTTTTMMIIMMMSANMKIFWDKYDQHYDGRTIWVYMYIQRLQLTWAVFLACWRIQFTLLASEYSSHVSCIQIYVLQSQLADYWWLFAGMQ